MTNRSVVHGNFTIERTYPASPARVFEAFADEQAKAKWFGGPEGFVQHEKQFDFRVGGREVLVGKHGASLGGRVSAFDCVYQDIVQDERIVYAYRMAMDGVPISVSLAIIEIRPEGQGTHLTVTEHGAFLDGYDDNGSREHGTGWLMGKLGESLTGQTVNNTI
jgi:uncharacterized protein YndB with AHSA1/START domain